MNAKNKIATTMLMVFCMTGMWAQKGDWAQLERYSDDNEKAKLLPQEQRRVVFFGNSITDVWAQVHPEFFKSNGYIGRGISGQTTYKYIVRLREDVINLKPKYVVIGGAIMIACGIKPGAAEIYGKVATFVFYLVMLVIIGFGPEIGAFRNYWTLPDPVLMVLVIISAILTIVAFASYMPATYRQVKEKHQSRMEAKGKK